MLVDNIPLELRLLPNWVCWKRMVRDGKPTKVPISPVTGKGADSTDPSTWTTFNLALEYRNDHNLDGLGFMFGSSDYMGVDLDATTDESIKEFHNQVETRLCSYTEFSVGGIGRHIILKETIPEGRKDPARAIELYADKRFFCMTGYITTPIPRPISSPNGELTSLWNYLFGDSIHTPAPVQAIDGPQIYDDNTILVRAFNAANGEIFRRLWNGDTSLHNNDHSAADLALQSILGFYTQNREQVIRLFHESNLGKRKKAYRPDYLERTVTKALEQYEGAPVSIDPSAFVTSDEEDKEELEELIDNTPIQWTRPPGLVGEIADFVYASAPYPIAEVALAAGLGLVSGICGRQWNVRGTGLNQYLLILAQTGTGKEAAASGIDMLMTLIAKEKPAISSFKGPGRIASGPALNKHLAKFSNCFLTIVGEFGITLQRMNSQHANEALKSLKGLLLDLYHKSGRGKELQPQIYSEREKNTPTIYAPAVTILGESTPETFYHALDDSSLADGLIPRFTLMEYTGLRPEYNEPHGTVLPDPILIKKLIDLTECSTRFARENHVIDVQFDELSTKAHLDFEKLASSNHRKADTGDLSRELWNRAHLKALKLAAVLAVGENPFAPRISLANFVWASDLVKRDIERIETRFKTGRTGPEESELNQMNLVVSTMKKFARSNHDRKADRFMRAEGIVPYRFISITLSCYGAFKNDHMGATYALRRAIDTLIKQGRVVLIPPAKGSNRGDCYRLT